MSPPSLLELAQATLQANAGLLLAANQKEYETLVKQWGETTAFERQWTSAALQMAQLVYLHHLVLKVEQLQHTLTQIGGGGAEVVSDTSTAVLNLLQQIAANTEPVLTPVTEPPPATPGPPNAEPVARPARPARPARASKGTTPEEPTP